MDSTLVKPKIWLLRSKPTSVPGNVYPNSGGALCIDKSGILMTTIFGICARTKLVSKKKAVTYVTRPEDFTVKAYDLYNNELDVELVYNCSGFGILFYQVVNGVELDLEFESLENVDQEFPVEDVFAYIHYQRLTYSALSAVESYPFPPNDLMLPDDVSNSTVELLSENAATKLYFDTMDCNPPYRMVENTIDLESCKKVNRDDAVLPEALQLYTKLPLLQFSGLDCDMASGSSGCSVFNIKNNELVGLILFNIKSSCFAVPLSVLGHCYKIFMRAKGEGRGGKGASGSGSGGKGKGKGKGEGQGRKGPRAIAR